MRANRDIAEDGSVRWRATWCAPADSVPVVLHVAANASNDDASALGDRIFLQQRRVLASSVDAANGEE
jgi:hypothetical protein